MHGKLFHQPTGSDTRGVSRFLKRAGHRSVANGSSVTSRAGADRRGAAAFEFALLLPLLMALSFGTIQYALMFYTYTAMSGAARYASLAIARGDRSASSAETIARSMLPSWVPAADYTVAIVDAAPGGTVSAQITVKGSKAAIIPFLPVPASLVTSPEHKFTKQ